MRKILKSDEYDALELEGGKMARFNITCLEIGCIDGVNAGHERVHRKPQSERLLSDNMFLTCSVNHEVRFEMWGVAMRQLEVRRCGPFRGHRGFPTRTLFQCKR